MSIYTTVLGELTARQRYLRYREGHLHLLTELAHAVEQSDSTNPELRRLTREMDEHRRLAWYWSDQVDALDRQAACSTQNTVLTANSALG